MMEYFVFSLICIQMKVSGSLLNESDSPFTLHTTRNKSWIRLVITLIRDRQRSKRVYMNYIKRKYKFNIKYFLSLLFSVSQQTTAFYFTQLTNFIVNLYSINNNIIKNNNCLFYKIVFSN